MTAQDNQPAGHTAWADQQRTGYGIDKVTEREGGYEISCDGWVVWLDKEHGVVPKAGQSLTLWGKGFGYPFRGVAVDRQVAFYRTEAEQAEHHKRQIYGADAAEWLSRWDAGKGVWTVQMGGLSAGYDQCINLMAAEFVRGLLKLKPELEVEPPSDVRAALDAECAEAINTLGLSGAQHGAALSLAVRIYKFGPMVAVGEAPDDRRIQASRSYPTLDPVILAAIRRAQPDQSAQQGEG